MRTLEGFKRRVWLFVTVVLAYLLLLQGLHAVADLQARQELQAETAWRARLAATTVLARSEESLKQVLRHWARGGSARRPTLDRSFFEQHGIVSVSVLTPEGWGIDARVGATRPDDSGARMNDATRRRLAAGEVPVDLTAAGGDPVYAVATAWRGVFDADGKMLGIVEVQVTAEALALAKRRFWASIAIEGGSLILFAILLSTFMRWTLRPLTLLSSGASKPEELLSDEVASRDDTGFVIETYRKVIEQLRDKEQELRRLREVERARADSLQELNASIVDSMLSGVLIADMSGNLRSTNEVARVLLGLDLRGGRVTGRPVGELLKDAPELLSRLRACIESSAVTSRDEIRLSLPGIGRRDIGLSVSPLRDAAGQPAGALCILTDLTEIKRLQEEVRLKQSLAELGELSASIAHEFRNSLAAIMGFAKLVERHGEGDAREHAEAISAECVQLKRVVDDFLRFANPTRLTIETVDLGRLLAELGDEVRARAAGRSVAYAVAPGLPVISGDETLLRRAFSNLVRNAVDAVSDGGRIAISASGGDREITIHVDDDGPGIPPEVRDRIFVPFFTRKETGTGLGLPLVRKVVVHHGGRIAVEDSPLGGARMSVSLPIRPGQAVEWHEK